MPGPEDREAWARYALHAAEVAHEETLSQVPSKGRYSQPPLRALGSLRQALRHWPPAPALDPQEIHAEFWKEPKALRLMHTEPAFYRVLHACCYAFMSAHGRVDPDVAREAARLAEYEREWGEEPRHPAPEFAPEGTARALALAAHERAVESLARVSGLTPERARELLAPVEARERVNAALLERLAPWLVGHGDPLQERVRWAHPGLRGELVAAEFALAAAPGDRRLLEAAADACRRTGWRYDGKTLDEWCSEFAQGFNCTQRATERLKELGPKATLAAIRVLEAPPDDVRDIPALELIKALGQNAQAAEDLLIRRAELSLEKEPGSCDVSWYSSALLAIGTPAGLAKVEDILRRGEPWLALGLSQRGSAATALLESMLDWKDPERAAWAAIALAPHPQPERLRPKLAYGLGASRLDHRSEYLRHHTLVALIAQGLVKEFKQPILECVDLRADPWVVVHACRAVVSEAWHNEPDVRSRLEKLLGHKLGIASDAARDALEGKAAR